MGAILGTSEVLGSTAEEVTHALQLPFAAARFEVIDGWRAQMPWLTSDQVVVTAHTTSDHYIIEIERDIAPVATDPTAMIATLLQAPSWQAFSEQTVKALGEMFGYARTMAYKFHPDYHGEVISEYLNQPDLEPFLGLHYPASDIPPQARRLYVLQLVRVIEDVDATDGPSPRLGSGWRAGARARSHLRCTVAPSRRCTSSTCATWAWPPPQRCRSFSGSG